MSKLQEALDRIKTAEARLEEAKAALAEAQQRDELVPWVPKDGGYERESRRPGVYHISLYKAQYHKMNPGFSRTKEQAMRRAQLDKVNDLLWGLKMQLEPDAEGDCQIYFAGSGWFFYRGHCPCVGAVIFTATKVEKVVDYLNKHYPTGEI